MRELSVSRQADRIIQAGIDSRKASRIAKNYLNSITSAPYYCEPGYSATTATILFGNWNNPLTYDKESDTFKMDCNTVKRVVKRLEEIGMELGWSDEWTTCSECGGAVRTKPDSMLWTPSYIIRDGCEVVCKECQGEDDWAEDDLDDSAEDDLDDSND